MAVAAASNQDDWKCIEYLLRTQPGIAITERVIIAAAGNEYCGEEIARLLLKNDGGITITEKIMIAAAENYHNGVGMTKLLLENGGDIAITEKVMIATAENYHNGVEVTELLLENGGDNAITEKVMLAAAKNNRSAETIIGQLIDCGNGGSSAVTENVMIIAVGNGDRGFRIVEQLFARENGLYVAEALSTANCQLAESQKAFTMPEITERVKAAAACEWRWGADLLEIFLKHYPGLTITITRRLVRGVAEGHGQKRQRMVILLTKFRAAILTDKAAEEIAKWFRKSKMVMSILHSIPRATIIQERGLEESGNKTDTQYLSQSGSESE